jgi:hypothetical protein
MSSEPTFKIQDFRAREILVVSEYDLSSNQAVAWAQSYLRNRNQSGWTFVSVEGSKKHYTVLFVNYRRRRDI